MRSSLSCCLAVVSALFLMSTDALAAPLCVKTDDPAIPAAYRCPAGATDIRSRPKATSAAERAAQQAEARKFAQSLRAALLQRSTGADNSAAEAEAAKKAAEQAAAEQAAAEQAAAEKAAEEQRQQEEALANENSGGSASGSVHLKWIIPASRENGRPLAMTDLAGYELYYVSEDETRSGVVAIDRPDQSEYVLGNLDPGAYFFAISAIDRDGLKSRLSPMVHTAVGS